MPAVAPPKPVIVKQGFGSVSSVFDFGYNVVDNTGLALSVVAGAEGVTLTHLNVMVALITTTLTP